MKKDDTHQRPADRLVFRTVSGTRLISPDRVVYVGYVPQNGDRPCMKLAYVSICRQHLYVEQLCHRSLRSMRLPEGGPIMQIHRRLYVNLDFVEGFDKRLRLTLGMVQAGDGFKVGRTFRKAFTRALGLSEG